MLGRKGGQTHIRAGRLYTYCMVAVAATAVLLCLLQPLTLGRLFLTGIAVLSFYLSFTGWRAARRHSILLPLPDRLLAMGTVVVGLLMVATGLHLQAVLFAFFGGLLCLFAGLDTKAFLRPSAAPAPWTQRHFTRMGGSYISAFTAFVVVNLSRWLPVGAPAWLNLVGWMAPTFIGTFLIFRAVRHFKATQRAVKTSGASAPVGLLPLLLFGLLATRPVAAQAPVEHQLPAHLTDPVGKALPMPAAYR
jgi:hypothetical protein